MTDKQTETSTFPIRELSARTQVNTVTIRAWERRYGLLKPLRTEKGHRLYSQADVATIEKVLALVARGVPLGKVKPLLTADVQDISEQQQEDTWRNQLELLMSAARAYSVNKVQHILSEAFGNYPAPLCAEYLLEPAFAKLAAENDDNAMLSLVENELMQYTSMRLNVKTNNKQRKIILMAGEQSPTWRLALMGLELADADYAVYVVYKPVLLSTGIELATHFTKNESSYAVLYQDGVWSHKDQQTATSAMSNLLRLYLCGTAPSLCKTGIEKIAYADVKSCIQALLKPIA